MKRSLCSFSILLGAIACAWSSTSARAQDPVVGLNVVLREPVEESLLIQLGAHGRVLDVLPQIRAVTLSARRSELAAIRSLPFVAAANPDAQRHPSALRMPGSPKFSTSVGGWSLDAIDVTDFGVGRTVDYDGEGVYVAVLDTGLVRNWRDYFPEDRIATQFARGFSGGGGVAGSVSSQPNSWERDTEAHGTAVTGIILGYRYLLDDPALAASFDGVAPRATIIPINDHPNDDIGYAIWSSTAGRSVLYITDLKRSGALGDAPVVINLSAGGPEPDSIEKAAIDYAIANGIVFVAAAGNAGSGGMGYPAAYAPVISVAATASVSQYLSEDSARAEWILGDVPEDDPLAHAIAPFSSWELAGQELDVAAPGAAVLTPWMWQMGQLDYSFFFGTSAAAPHVAGIAALLLQKNPTLTAAEIETILEATAMPLLPSCRNVRDAGVGPGNPPTLRDHANVFFYETTYCWPAAATSHGLVDAAAALQATPLH